ncbi:MAG: type II toxin-antitoxin system RelE/ParE family toxin [Armatimonadetes bacterium]|nr:type II toxin-antitoxin system RelE/ParE family toxin [Armatimonadota bacterium]
MSELRWSPEAVAELDRMPLSWARRLYETVELIAAVLRMGRVREELGGSRAFLSGYHHIVYDWFPDDEVVFVVALLDC